VSDPPLGPVGHHLHPLRGVDHELAAVDASTQPPARVIPRRDASWWASGGAWAVGGVLAAAAGFALVLMWVPVQPADAPPTGATPPPLAEADRFDPGDLLERLRLPQTPEAVLAAQSRLAALQSWSPPRLLDEQGVAQSVALLGRGAEEPLRQEWDRLVAGVSTVVGQFEQLWPAADTFPADRDQSRAAPDPAASA